VLALRAQPETAHSPIPDAVRHGEPSSGRLTAGASDYLVKPSSVQLLARYRSCSAKPTALTRQYGKLPRPQPFDALGIAREGRFALLQCNATLRALRVRDSLWQCKTCRFVYHGRGSNLEYNVIELDRCEH
jgi:ribosomal protein L37AE/L43A